MLIRGELKKKLAVGINPDVKKNTRNVDIGGIREESEAQTEYAMSFRMITRRRNNSRSAGIFSRFFVFPSYFRYGAQVKRSYPLPKIKFEAPPMDDKDRVSLESTD